MNANNRFVLSVLGVLLALGVALLMAGVAMLEQEQGGDYQARALAAVVGDGDASSVTYLGVLDVEGCDGWNDHGWYYYRVTPADWYPARALVCVKGNGLIVIDWLLHEWDTP